MREEKKSKLKGSQCDDEEQAGFRSQGRIAVTWVPVPGLG